MISLRIQKIAEMVQPGMVVADIGTDHAFLPILLIQNGTAEKVYACDIGEGPLKQAEANIAKEGLQDQIICVLSDGFEHVPEDTEAAVLAGMGYYTAADILDDAKERLPGLKQILVEVNRNVKEMRQWISDRCYTIDDEECVCDKGFYYIIISFTAKPHEPYSKQQILCGPVLMQKQTETYKAYCRKQISRLDLVIANSKDPQAKENALHEKIMWEEAENA